MDIFCMLPSTTPTDVAILNQNMESFVKNMAMENLAWESLRIGHHKYTLQNRYQEGFKFCYRKILEF